MTLCHIQLRKTEESNTNVTYAAISPDSNEKFLDEKMAIIVLNKILKTNEFIPGENWVG